MKRTERKRTERLGKDDLRKLSHLFDPTDSDKTTAANFFFVFSRFEYVLKRAGFTKPAPPDRPDLDKAEVDWTRYARGVRVSRNQNEELAEAMSYLESEPPLLQTVQADGSLGWKKPERWRNQTDVGWLLFLVRTVRNNLFHGGKFPIPDGPVPEPARDAKLLRNSLVVLGVCLERSPEVRRYFWESLYE